MRTVSPKQRSIGNMLATAAVACLAGAGCTVDSVAPGASTTTRTTPINDKVGTGLGPWVSQPRWFAHDLRLTSMAVTPARMLAVRVVGDVAKLVELQDSGAVLPFAGHFVTPPSVEGFIAIASGMGGFESDWVYVGAGNEVSQLTPDGNISRTVTMIPTGAGPIAGLCFDTAGSFAHQLLILTAGGWVYGVDAADRVRFLGDVGAGGRGPNVAPARFPGFGGRLLIAFPDLSEVRSLSPGGEVSVEFGWSGVSGVVGVPEDPRAFGASGAAFFVATEAGTVLRHAQQGLAGRGGQIVLTSRLRSGSGILIPEGAGYTWRAFSSFWGAECAAAFACRPVVTSIRLDIVPGVDDNAITMGSTLTIPVGILSSVGFVPSALEGADLLFAGARPVQRGRAALGTYADLNADGVPDLVLRFRPADMQLHQGSMRLLLEGTTLAGERVRGSDLAFVVTP